MLVWFIECQAFPGETVDQILARLSDQEIADFNDRFGDDPIGPVGEDAS
jgi:mannitol-1-phosphate/altronate dehydrogenase